MHFLIDGHNLIAQMPGIDLSDADDEAQLVQRLRSFAASKRGQHILVVFDHGVYGHPHQLNGYGVTCYFAKSPQDADTQLIRRLRTLERPHEWTLVSSDRMVVDVALERRVKVISSHEFAERLSAPPPRRSGAPTSEKPERRLSEAEVAEWMQIFGLPPDGEPDLPEPPPPPKVAPPKAKKKKPKR